MCEAVFQSIKELRAFTAVLTNPGNTEEGNKHKSVAMRGLSVKPRKQLVDFGEREEHSSCTSHGK